MLCENCGRRPAQKFTKKVGGRELTVELCPECFRALYPEKESVAFASLVGAGGREDAACPVCGMTFGEFRRTGLLGCAGCYRAFREDVLATVRGIQGKLHHTGKHPDTQAEERYDRMRAYLTRRESLREKLEEAMRGNDYSAARRLQRELRELADDAGEKR